ncbi:hypothetical protein KM1_029250 [Entamoeba histolytica HM-3:IMSS]|uniref:Uncharacterized protein n=2 Tax=Entamoeba histolytica TaxID=5759 RepID=A0A175JW59_ENTHI|nr:hypothetical protein KM1_029250 [Entamoeba histolytica HM-3:IMSS]GAT98019.1 hypothetical protein CL6EHI_146920 [Entamoeba histolytica]
MEVREVIEKEFLDNYKEMKRMVDPLVFGNLKSETEMLVKDARIILHKERVIEEGREVIEETKRNEEAEEILKKEIVRDKRREIIEKDEELQRMEKEIEELKAEGQRAKKLRDMKKEELECEKYGYKTESKILEELEMKNELMGKMIKMKGDLDEGILICNKRIITFNMKGMKREERKIYLSELIINEWTNEK